MCKQCGDTAKAHAKFGEIVHKLAEILDEPMVVAPGVAIGIAFYRPDFLMPLLHATFRFTDHLPEEGKQATSQIATQVCDLMMWGEVTWEHGSATVDDALANWSPSLVAALQSLTEVRIMYTGTLSQDEVSEICARFGPLTYPTPAQDVTTQTCH